MVSDLENEIAKLQDPEKGLERHLPEGNGT